ncbi:hypothetical protein D3C72_1237390 [compost metagenome]
MLLQAPEPHLAGLLVPLLHAATGPGDLVGTHLGVTHQDHPIVAAVGAQQPQGIKTLLGPAGVVLPDKVVEAIVKIEVLQMLELVAQRREEPLHLGHVGIHGPPNIEEDQQLDPVVALGSELHIEPALAGRAADGVVEIQLRGIALAHPAPELAQRQLDGPLAERRVVAEVAIMACLPHLGCLAMLAFSPHADPFGVEAAMAERTAAPGAHPLVAAGVARLLFAQALVEGVEQLVEPAEGSEQGFLLRAQ